MGNTAATRQPLEPHRGVLSGRLNPLPVRSGPARPLPTDDARLLRMAEAVGSMGHWHAKVATGETVWSPQVYEIFGKDPATFTPHTQSIQALCHPDDLAKIEIKAKAAIATRSSFEYDLRIMRPDGTRTIISTCQPEFDDAGTLVAVFGVCTDVTEAFDAIRSIQDQNEMLDLAAKLARLGHWVWSRDDGRMSFCSAELANIHDLAPGAFVRAFTRPDMIATVVVAEDRERFRDTVTAALNDARGYDIAYRIKTGAGALKDLHEVGQPILDKDGTLVRFIATVQDITEAKRQTEALARSEAKLRHVIEGSIQGIIVLRDFKPVFVNQAYARLMGLESPEAVMAAGDTRALMSADAAACAADFWNAVMNGRGESVAQRNAPMTSAEGKDVWTDCIGRRIDWDGEPAVLITVIDVTERYLAEEELKRKTRELQDLNQQKDKLFSIIAHDLRSPFNSIIGFAELLATRAKELSRGQVASYAQIVREAATGVHNLLDNLLAWASFQIRDSALKLAPLDMAAVAAASLEPLAHMAEGKNITLANTIGAITAMGDELLVRIVIRNLVSNGIKFSRPGGVVQITGTVSSDSATPMVRITVRDDGVGLSQAALANMFELSGMVSAPGTRGETGTGLGLYLCRDIIVRHGGTVTVDSTPGAGTAFHFTLPACRARS